MELEIAQEHARGEEEHAPVGVVLTEEHQSEGQQQADGGPEAREGGEGDEDDHGAVELDGEGPQVGVVGVLLGAVHVPRDGIDEVEGVLRPVGHLAGEAARARGHSRTDGHVGPPALGAEVAQVGHEGGGEAHDDGGDEEPRVAAEGGGREGVAEVGPSALAGELERLVADGVAGDHEEHHDLGIAGDEQADEGPLDEQPVLIGAAEAVVDVPPEP